MPPSLVKNRVTIAIPTYNRSALLLRALHSALAQTYPEIEVLVSDNASDDDTAALLATVRDRRFICVRQPRNLGMTANWNACVALATGEFFHILSDDDVLEPTAIERLVHAMRQPPHGLAPETVGLAWCPCLLLDGDGHPLWTTAAGPEAESGLDLVIGVFEGTRGPRLCSILLRTADLRAIGGYAQRHGPLCDVGAWSQIVIGYPNAVCVPEPLARYTSHSGSITSNSGSSVWRQSGETICHDLVSKLRAKGDMRSAARLRRASSANISNLIVTVMMQRVGKPGWIGANLRDIAHNPRYFVNRTVFRRLLKDGWKLLRLMRRSA